MADGVPRLGVTNVGEVANTNTPEPVSSVITVAKFALEGVARNVATPEPRTEIPVDTGRPVAEVNTAYEGVPILGVIKVGLFVKATVLDPLSSVRALAKLALEGVARNVATPEPNPEIPVDTGNPVTLVITPEAGVPRAGVTNVGEVANTRAPDPVSSDISAAS